MASSTFRSHDTVFQVTEKDYCDRVVEVEASTNNLMEKYFPDTLVERIVQASSQYINKQKEKHPDLYCWKKKK
eukprot:2097446-Ditylum_brightwellii.AAC.1